MQLRLGALTGVTSIDATRGEATVRAGTPLHVLNEELAAFGCALPNLGDIDRQSLAGATGTGTHGTGLRLTGLSAGDPGPAHRPGGRVGARVLADP